VIRSMTGYAERSFVSATLRLKIGIKTLNHRFFDWTYKGAPIGRAENNLRTLCQREIRRGRVEVILDLMSLDPRSWSVSINEGLLEKVLAPLERVARRRGAKLDVSLETVFKIPQLVELSRKELAVEEVRFLEASFVRTLDEVVRLRAKEGRETARLIRGHIRTIRRSVRTIEARFRRQPGRVREKLKRRLRELNHGQRVSEERLAEESAYLTQRLDLAEEIGRLKSHLKTLEELLAPSLAEPVGKQLDFLAQELNREANTASSKSQDIAIIRETLAVKNEVESIRQQVQNIE
jgi:uncharacterized protein (TIGR00255 family)